MTELLEKLRASLSDRYDVEREIGEGGMATVFLASDVRHGRRVAIKVLHEDLGAALGAERFKREIQIATSLTHPHILTLYDSGEAAGSLFYVMPFIEGESLRQRMDREKQMPIDKALKITGEVASALDYAHRKGVIHRDIKPENILLEDGHAIVADFGIARAVSTMGDAQGALTKTGMSLGTPTYMSPEQAFADKDIDGRSDLYSLACVLYEMLVGQPPFTGPNAMAVMARHSMAEVPSMQIVRQTIPDEVEQVVQRALAKAPADRFATVAEFAQELEECVIDYHTTTRRAVDRRSVPRVPPGRRTEDVPALPRWKKKPALIGLAAAALIAIGGAGWWIWGRQTGPAVGADGLDPKNVAVMYFQDSDPTGELEYLAEGFTEHLIARLDEVQGLGVISEDGVAQFRGATGVSVDSIARVLKVGTVVRGTVLGDANRVRVKINVYDGNTGEIDEDEEFDLPRANILATQDSLAALVANMLRERVGTRVEVQTAKAGTSNPQAWTLYQRAQKLRRDADAMVARNDPTGAGQKFDEADALLVQAAATDGRWNEPVVARSAIALARARAAGTALEAKPWIEKGIGDAETIIARSARDAGALEMRGSLRYLSWAYSLASNKAERDALLDGAESDLKTAVDVDPTRASAWNALSTVHSQKGNTPQAKMAAQRAYEADAYLSGTEALLWKLYATSYDQRQFTDAVTYCDDGAKRFPDDPRFVRCKLWLQTVKAVQPDPDAAWREYQKISSTTPLAGWSPQDWRLLQAEGRMLVAASLARKKGVADSARKVLASGRPNPDDDKEGELAGVEAFILTLFETKQDTTAALEILNRYASGSPQHREGLAKSELWWWAGLKNDPRFPR